MTKFKFDQIDAAESLFASRSLEQIRSKMYEVRYPMLKGRTLVPVSNETNPGVEVIVTQYMKSVGEAQITSDYASNAPRVDVTSGEYVSKVASIDMSYGYSFQELRAAKFAGRDLATAKAKACRDAIERKLDDCILNGSILNGFRGLMNQTGVSNYAIAVPWAGATPAQILADLQAIEAKVINDSLEIEAATDLLLPTAAYALLMQPRSTTSDMTILQYFLANSRSIKNVTTYVKAGSTGVAYTKDPDKLHAEIPMEFTQLQPEVEGKQIVTICEARTGGVIVDFPGSMLYITGF